MQIRQSSLSGGEMGQQFLGKTDQERYHGSLQTQRNAWITRYGSVENRSGTEFIDPIKNQATQCRLARFTFGQGIGYLLEISATAIRIYKDGAPISVVGSSTWNSGITYPQGTVVLYSGSYYYSIQAGNVGNQPNTSAAYWYYEPVIGGVPSLEIPATIPQTALQQLQYVQQNSILVITHQSMHPISLTRLSDQQWVLSQYQLNVAQVPVITSVIAGFPGTATVLAPASVTATGGDSAGSKSVYQIASWSISEGSESPPSATATATVGAADAAHPVALSWAAAAGADGYIVFKGITGSGPYYAIAYVIGATVFTDPGLSPIILLPAPGLGGNSAQFTYVVTAVDANGNEGLPSAPMSTFVSKDPTTAAPNVITWTPTGQTEGDTFTSVSNGGQLVVTLVTPGTATVSGTFVGTLSLEISQDGVNWTIIQTVTAPTTDIGITINSIGIYRWICSAYTSGTATTTITTTPAASYNIYLSTNVLENGVFGYIGQSFTDTFNDTYITPNISQQPPVAIPMFQTPNDWPAVCGAYQQRLFFANTINQPATAWGSAIGLISGFLVGTPETDSMAVQFTIAGKVIQYIQALVDMGHLIIHTSNGEYLASGNQFNAITPSAIGLALQGTQGSQLINPVQIGITGIYVQSRGTIIRDLQYSIYTNTFVGKDTTIYSPQIFEGQTILYLDWQQILHSIVWGVLSDGQICSMTYSKDENVWGWAHHDTVNGIIEQLCVVPENTQDSIYLVVMRTINGEPVRYIERIANRDFQDTQYLTDAVFTDCSLTYDGHNTNGSNAIYLVQSTGWTVQDIIQIDTSTAAFTSANIGDEVVIQLFPDGTDINPLTGLPYPGGIIPPANYVLDSVWLTITSYSTTQRVYGTPNKNVPIWAQEYNKSGWGIAQNTFSGLTQLAGQAISGLGDGEVVMNALTDLVPTVVSSGGTFTTPGAQNYLVLTVGLPIYCQLQTMPVPDHKMVADTPIGKRLVCQEITPVFYQTRGGGYGSDLDHMFPWEQRGIAMEPMGQPVALYTGPRVIPITGNWNDQGSVWIQQIDPLPLSVSAIVTTVRVGN